MLTCPSARLSGIAGTVCTLPVERKEKECTERTHACSPHAYAISSELGGLAGHVGKWQL